MKYIKSINEYFSNINEGINYNNGVDADLSDIGYNVLQSGGKNPDDMDDKEIEKAAIEAMKKAKPVPLTGQIKKDLPAFLKYVGDAFKKCGVELDTNNTDIDSSNFANELMIPTIDNPEFYFNTMLDYNELASNGSEFVVGGAFASDDEGSLDYTVSDLSDQGDIMKCCQDYKKFIENTQK
jgi:hypothetical protein